MYFSAPIVKNISSNGMNATVGLANKLSLKPLGEVTSNWKIKTYKQPVVWPVVPLCCVWHMSVAKILWATSPQCAA